MNMNDDIVSILMGAVLLLNTKEQWTQGTFARDKNNNPVPVVAIDKNISATKWCLAGAIKTTCLVDNRNTCSYSDVILFLYNYTNMGIARFNDSHTYEEVYNVLMSAIAENMKLE